jgi:hypothetical protein
VRRGDVPVAFLGVKSGGLPCRIHSCRAAFAVTNGDSMAALLEASARRKAHELEVHAYEHVVPVEPEAEGSRGPLRSRRTSAEVAAR